MNESCKNQVSPIGCRSVGFQILHSFREIRLKSVNLIQDLNLSVRPSPLRSNGGY